jgi:hypothetical protein
MIVVRHVSDDERRARLAARHALAAPVGSPEEAVRAMTALHATEAATVYLSAWARVAGFTTVDLDRALYDDRTVVKQLAMRRTLFVFARELLPAVWPSASARVAATERARLVKDVSVGLGVDGDDWVDRARVAVLAALGDAPAGLTVAEVRRAVPLVDIRVEVTAGAPVTASRVLTQLSATADVVRGANTGGWHASRPRWTLTRNWLGDSATGSTADGYRELVRRWLHTFGPGTEDDLVWWLGATRTVVRAALGALSAVPVALDRGATGWLLPDDLDPVPPRGPWVALLPVLDPTVMGWKGRDFHLGPHRDQIFDRRGNAGTTAWVDGRVVGCWIQDAHGVVRVRLLEPVTPGAGRALDAEADRLTAWLGGFRVPMVYRSPAMAGAVTG